MRGIMAVEVGDRVVVVVEAEGEEEVGMQGLDRIIELRIQPRMYLLRVDRVPPRRRIRLRLWFRPCLRLLKFQHQDRHLDRPIRLHRLLLLHLHLLEYQSKNLLSTHHHMTGSTLQTLIPTYGGRLEERRWWMQAPRRGWTETGRLSARSSKS